MLLVTGGAGFIGSNVVADLNEAGRTDVAISDMLGSDDKWRNLARRQIADFVPPAELRQWLEGRKLEAVIHLGAISSTTARDGDEVMENNFRLSLRLLDWCTAARTPFIYASSAATYGDGQEGYSDDWADSAFKRLRPMNLYGWSSNYSILPSSSGSAAATSCRRNGRALSSLTCSGRTNITRAK